MRSFYVKNSALWAAYGDALGFMTELADLKGVLHRTKVKRVVRPITWRRRIGGQFGVFIDLPAGCYSDDTELRLATSRAIRGNGDFDVEAFSKVELPVWLTYALGAGRGTKAAASNLLKSGVTWMTNFYDFDGLSYVRGGGNGAAMRIQPHVWAVAHGSPEKFLVPVLRNSICTHGHPRGIVGAAFHALTLFRAMNSNIVPRPEEWRELIEVLHVVPELIVSDNQLSSFWLPTWEKLSNSDVKDAFYRAISELKHDAETTNELLLEKKDYASVVANIGGLSLEERGSGTKTALLAVVAAFIFRTEPDKGMVTISNLLGSDTDTIATMAGALLGATIKEEPPCNIKDQAYIEEEAARIYKLSIGETTPSFNYPDLLRWTPPSSPLDFIGSSENSIALAGFGECKEAQVVAVQQGKYEMKWQWLTLPFGQTVLVKSRAQLSPLNNAMLPRQKLAALPHDKAQKSSQQNFEFDDRIYPKRDTYEKKVDNGKSGGMNVSIHSGINTFAFISIDEATKHAIDSGFEPTLIGQYILEFSKRRNGIELAIAFTSIIAKARIARLNLKSSS